MRFLPLPLLAAALIATAFVPFNRISAQQPAGPQSTPPPAVTPPPPTPPAKPTTGERVTIAAGTRIGVILENGLSTRGAKPGDSVYLQTSFPVTQNNRVIIPVGSYIRGEILEAKRPGRVKGRGEMRLRLNTLILPNGYTIDLNAEPTGGGDTGGKETIDREGKIEGGSNKGGDVAKVAETTSAGAVIGAIAGGGKGAGIGAGAGGLVGLAAVLLTRGPEVQMPRGTSLDIVLERAIILDADKLPFTTLGQMSPMPAAAPPRP
jgi:hypothetical protein